ncbi:MAG: IS5 family transposase [Alphaproteobacteria bacterium]
MDRLVLNDTQWARIAPFLPGKAEDCGVTADNRRFVEAVLWMARTGAPWRDLPREFGNWNSVFKRFRRWVAKGVFERLFQAVSGEPDFDYALVDGTIVRVHQHGAGAKGGPETQAIGRSRGGLTTKVLALVDALGNLARFMLMPGQRHDSIGVDSLLDGVTIDALIADKAFDNNAIRKELAERGALAVIPSKADRKTAIPHDAEMDAWRHLVENDFAKIKHFRRIATRYDKTDTSQTDY